jgi:hypothetical protein
VHDARRTCVTLLVALDVHLQVIMRILRHADQAVTMRSTQRPARRRPATLVVYVTMLTEQPILLVDSVAIRLNRAESPRCLSLPGHTLCCQERN